MNSTRRSTLAWRHHFQQSLAEELTPPVRDRWAEPWLAHSLAQFQLGESSEGRHLLEYARQTGDRLGDPWLGETMALFIAEENRHSRWLGEFLVAQGEPLLQRHWLDSVFRALRKPMGLGLMVAVLVCGEIVAVPYYDAVRRATTSQWLQAICRRLLRDEAHHLQFQAGNLALAWSRWPATSLFRAAHQALLVLTCLAAWKDHGRVLRAGGYSFPRFLRRCRALLAEVHAGATTARPAHAASVKIKQWS